MFHERTNHIDVRYHLVHDVMTRGDIVVSNINAQNNLVDMMTKTLLVVKFEHLLYLIGLHC